MAARIRLEFPPTDHFTDRSQAPPRLSPFVHFLVSTALGSGDAMNLDNRIAYMLALSLLILTACVSTSHSEASMPDLSSAEDDLRANHPKARPLIVENFQVWCGTIEALIKEASDRLPVKTKPTPLAPNRWCHPWPRWIPSRA